jgi:hypothetical protein
LGDIGWARGRALEHQVNWQLRPGASLADLATIELRRIIDVLQIDHASLFLRDADDPERARAVAETGLPAREALPEYCTLLTRAIRTARAAKVERFGGSDATCCAALAAPLMHDERALGALLVVTRRANRRLGAIDSEVVQTATQTLVERFLAPGDRGEPRFSSERFIRTDGLRP